MSALTITIWPAASAPDHAKKMVENLDPSVTPRAYALVPAEAVGWWEPDAFDGREVPVWTTGWEWLRWVAPSLDATADPMYVRLNDGRVLIVGKD